MEKERDKKERGKSKREKKKRKNERKNIYLKDTASLFVLGCDSGLRSKAFPFEVLCPIPPISGFKLDWKRLRCFKRKHRNGKTTSPRALALTLTPGLRVSYPTGQRTQL
jgi:hypothetical protein